MPKTFWIESKPLSLRDPRKVATSAVKAALNRAITIPAFSATSHAWAGASVIAARANVPVGVPWSLKTPIIPPNATFCAAIKWVVDGVVTRLKLFSGVGEKLSYPLYHGEIIPATGAIIEFWTVEATPTVVLTAEWRLDTTALELPTEFFDVTSVDLYTASAPCVTITSPGPASFADYMNKCL